MLTSAGDPPAALKMWVSVFPGALHLCRAAASAPNTQVVALSLPSYVAKATNEKQDCRRN